MTDNLFVILVSGALKKSWYALWNERYFPLETPQFLSVETFYSIVKLMFREVKFKNVIKVDLAEWE